MGQLISRAHIELRHLDNPTGPQTTEKMTNTDCIGTHPGQVTGVPPGQHLKTNPRVNTQASGSQVVDKPPEGRGASPKRSIPSPKQKSNKKATLADGFSLPADHCNQRGYRAKVLPGIELFLQGATPQLSSPQLRFTTEFEMDRCYTAPWTQG